MITVTKRGLRVHDIERYVELLGSSNVTLFPDGVVELKMTEELAQEQGFIVDKPKENQPALLGKQTPLPESPDKAIIDTVPNNNWSMESKFVARFTVPEFTSMCPVTGQPDFARIFIDYIPGARMIESKALKLFMGSFRNHGAFHEECTMLIKDRLIDALIHNNVPPHVDFWHPPVWFRIAAYWYPRGGIPIDVFWQSKEPPREALIPDLPKLDFAGR